MNRGTLRLKPSEWFQRGQFYISFDLEERMLPCVIEWLGAGKRCFSSDYPHWDTEWPNAVKTFISEKRFRMPTSALSCVTIRGVFTASKRICEMASKDKG
jgi:hypothetical protein